MTKISASQVKELRDRTNVAMMACKNALEETGGDMEKAIEILRKRGAGKAADKSSRETSEGRVVIAGRIILKILCETDFVAKNDDFINFTQSVADKGANDGLEAAKEYFESTKSDKIQELGENLVLAEIHEIAEGDIIDGYTHSDGKTAALVALSGGSTEQARDVAMHAVAMNPKFANPSDVSAEEIEKEKTIYREQLLAEGKPEQIIEKIMIGKVQKFCAEQALTSQNFVKDPSQTVESFLGDVKLINFTRLAV